MHMIYVYVHVYDVHVCLCVCECEYVLAMAYMHTMACIWNTKDQLRCQYSPSTLFADSVLFLLFIPYSILHVCCPTSFQGSFYLCFPSEWNRTGITDVDCQYWGFGYWRFKFRSSSLQSKDFIHICQSFMYVLIQSLSNMYFISIESWQRTCNTAYIVNKQTKNHETSCRLQQLRSLHYKHLSVCLQPWDGCCIHRSLGVYTHCCWESMWPWMKGTVYENQQPSTKTPERYTFRSLPRQLIFIRYSKKFYDIFIFKKTFGPVG